MLHFVLFNRDIIVNLYQIICYPLTFILNQTNYSSTHQPNTYERKLNLFILLPFYISFHISTLLIKQSLNIHKYNLLSILIFFFFIIYNVYIIHRHINKLVINIPSHEVKSSLSINLSLWNLSLS